MITGTFSADDYIAAQRLHRQKDVRWYYGIGAITTLLGATWLYSTRELESLILLGAGVGALLGESAVAFIYLPWKARRMHRQQRDFASPFTYTWNAETIEAQGVNGQSKRRWKDYHKVRENQELFLLYHNDQLYEAIPKRWFRDEPQIEDFRSHAAIERRT